MKHRGKLTSSSSYMLDLNVGANTVYLSRPPPSNYSLESVDSADISPGDNQDMATVRTSEQREFVPESGKNLNIVIKTLNGGTCQTLVMLYNLARRFCIIRSLITDYIIRARHLC